MLLDPVKDGAVPDGQTDCTAAIRTTLSEALRYPYPVGIILNGGRWAISDVLDIEGAHDFEFVGVAGATIVQTTPGQRVFRVFGDTDNVTIRGLRLQGPCLPAAGNGAAVVVGHDSLPQDGTVVAGVTVKGCTISGFRHAGVLAYGAAFGAAVPQKIVDLAVTGNRIFDCQSGVFLYKNVHGASVTGNRLRNIWDTAVGLDTRAASDQELSLAGSDVTIGGNIIVTPGAAGLSANVAGVTVKGGWDGVHIGGNTIRNVARNGLATRAYGVFVTADYGNVTPSGLTIVGNPICDVDDDGIACNDVDGLTVAANPIRRSRRGIYIARCVGFDVSGNPIRDTGPASDDYAIAITGFSGGKQATTGRVTGNPCVRGTGGASYAIFHAQSDRVTVDGNPHDYPQPVLVGGSVD